MGELLILKALNNWRSTGNKEVQKERAAIQEFH